MTKNAELLKQNSADVAREASRGIVDIETLKRVNDDLIATIQDTLQIQRESRAARQSVETELVGIETQLKQALLAAMGGQ